MKVTDQDERLLDLIKGDLSSCIFAVTVLLELGENILIDFLETYGDRELSHEGIKFKSRKRINRGTYSGHTYIIYERDSIRCMIYCGHCVSVFIPEDMAKYSGPIIDLTKEPIYESNKVE